ncbi:armadillo-type protein [Mycena capillaripes]|nr:armadillo-type protein [Mycena capillaripes]
MITTLRNNPRSTTALFSRRRGPSSNSESGTHGSNPPSGHSIPVELTPAPSKNHTGFVIVGLVCLAIIHIILLVDVELTLQRNKENQSPEEDEWGFGQVLALLLLVIPLRDFRHLRQAINDDTFEGHDFEGLIEQGANPAGELDGNLHVKTLLQFSAYKGNEVLVKYLQEQHVEDSDGGSFLAAVRNKQLGTAYLLKDGNKSTAWETTRKMFALVVQLLEDSDEDLRRATINCLASLGAQAGLQEEIRPAIPRVVKLLEDSDGDVRRAAINCLPRLGAQAEVHQEIHLAIVSAMKLLDDSFCLGTQAGLQQEIRPAISRVIKLLEDSDENVRQAAVNCLSCFAAQVELQQEIRPAIARVMTLLDDSSCLGAHSTYSLLIWSLLAYTLKRFLVEFQEIQLAISGVIKLLDDSDTNLRQAGIDCLSHLGTQVIYCHQKIRPGISIVIQLLKDSDNNVRHASIDCLSSLGTQVSEHEASELQQEIRAAIAPVMTLLDDSGWWPFSLHTPVELRQEIQPAIWGVIKLLEHSAEDVRRTAINCLSRLGEQAELQQEIRAAIAPVMTLLDDSCWWSAIDCLSKLGTQAGLQQEIQPAISRVIKSLQDSDGDVLSEHKLSELQHEIQPAMSRVIQLLKDAHEDILSEHTLEIQPAISGVIKLLDDSKWSEIRPAISGVVKLLEDSDESVRQAAIGFLSSLEVQNSQLLLIAIPHWTLSNPAWTGILASLPGIIASASKN